MSTRQGGPTAPWPEQVTLHGLAWLTLANAVGLLLATLLLAPRLGEALAPLTYGRWVPVHLNLELYGWCGVPLVGLLFALYLPHRNAGPLPGLALGVWSGTLLFGAVSWLEGATSAKPFLDWSGTARLLLTASFLVFELVLVAAFLRDPGGADRGAAPGRRLGRSGKGLLLVVLAAVPWVMWIATSPRTYPPINPASGGPTGASLLGSTLGVVWIFVAAPWILGLPASDDRPHSGGRLRGTVRTVAVLAVHTAVFLAMDHGNHSHHEAGQILALASLAVWWPLLRSYFRRFRWPRGSRGWLLALGAWSGVLLATAVATFLPGALEALKFTNALVGHAHLAMAALVTSFLVLLLLRLGEGSRLDGLFASRLPFALWQGGCALHILSLAALGVAEGLHPGLAALGSPLVTTAYAARWVGGASMLGANVAWLEGARRRLGRELPQHRTAESTGEAFESAVAGARS